MLDNYKDILSVNEVCEILQIGKNKIYELLSEGKIKSIKIGRCYKIPKYVLVEFLGQLK